MSVGNANTMTLQRTQAKYSTLYPMNIGRVERVHFENTFAKVEESGPDEIRSEVVLIKQQLELHDCYANACEKLEDFADEIRDKGDHLVSLRFPMRLTQKTRDTVERGLFRSFTRFVHDLHCTILQMHGVHLADAVTNSHAFLQKLSDVLTLESCRVIDGVVTHQEARAVCTSYIKKCRADAVRVESSNLASLDHACKVVLEMLQRFCKASTTISKSIASGMRKFLKSSERKGLAAAARRLSEEHKLRVQMHQHSWMLGGALDDEQLVKVHNLILLTHRELSDTLSWQLRRTAWLWETNSSNGCWCGVSSVEGLNGVLVHAPAHMRSFYHNARVRLVLEPKDDLFTCYLSSACVANILLDLLHTRRLVLNRISSAYANRILTFDFCKYESAAQNILENTIRPWCKKTQCGVLN